MPVNISTLVLEVYSRCFISFHLLDLTILTCMPFVSVPCLFPIEDKIVLLALLSLTP
jgi:hypothetical protein